MVNKEDKKYKKGFECLKVLTKRFNLQNKVLEIYNKGGRCASLLTDLDPNIIKIVVTCFENIFENTFVYYVIFQETSFGPVVNMLYLNDNEEEWYLNDVNEEGWIYAATLNLDGDGRFEFGDICLDSTEHGVLCRKG